MVATIAPLVKEASRVYWEAWIGHAVAAALAGGSLGLIVSLIGLRLGWADAGFGIAIALTVAYAFREVGALRLPATDRIAAVPFSWRERYGRVHASWLYGLALGFGFSARTPYTSFHLMLVWLVAIGDPRVGLVVGVAYGLARGFTPLASAATNASPHQADTLFGLAADMRALHIANAVTLALVGGAALGAVLW